MWKVVDAIINAYKSVYGAEKWNSLTADEQHEVITTMAKDFLEIAKEV